MSTHASQLGSCRQPPVQVLAGVEHESSDAADGALQTTMNAMQQDIERVLAAAQLPPRRINTAPLLH